MGIFAHREQIFETHAQWQRKPDLQQIYQGFYRLIAAHLSQLPERRVVELGSGIGNIKTVIPDCLTTDMFITPWSEQVENAYHLSFEDRSVSDLIMVDVFHHLQYPGTALDEFHRVLQPGGRVLLLEPHISLLGNIVYGLLHPEGLRRKHAIQWYAPHGAQLDAPEYYTSQGNATRIFLGKAHQQQLRGWTAISVLRVPAIAYLATGGYTRPQFLPGSLLRPLLLAERIFDRAPGLFSIRMLVVLTA